MIKLISNLLQRAGIIRVETIDDANSAQRVGSLFEDIIRSGISKYDPTVSYEAGQYVVYEGVLSEAVTNVAANQGPGTTIGKTKWATRLITDPVQATLTNHLPIAGSAVVKLIALGGGNGASAPNASETQRGLARQATAQEVNTGTNNDAYVTPAQLKSQGGRSLASLLETATEDEKSDALKAFLDSAQADALARLCQMVGQCGVVIPPMVYNFTNGVDYEAIPAVVTPLQPSYTGRFDVNNCDEFRGWFVDINNPTIAPVVRIERNGIVIANLTATIERTDVRDALILRNQLPAGSTYAIYGYSYAKVSSDKNGQPNTYKAFGGTSSTQATTDAGVNPTVTCGSVVIVNPPTVNNPPRIVGIYKDQEVYDKGDQLLAPITGLFSDEDALTFSATMGDGQPLDYGISFNPGDAQPFKIAASYPNQQRPIKLIATDTVGQSTPKSFLLTVARQVVTDNPVTVTGQVFGGDTETLEGNGARVKIINVLSNGATSEYNGGGTYRIVAPYPDQMTIQTDANAVGVILTKETVVADVQVTLEFTFPDQRKITGPFTVKNKTVATSPIVSQLINNVGVIEGNQVTVQLYDVHADGNWTEVTQSDGRFDLVGQYPNGMTISQSTTGRAIVSTAGNSVTADVPVTVRYTPTSGSVVEGIVTVLNQPSTTPEDPTPDQRPYVEKLAVYVPSGTTTAVVHFFIKVRNIPVGTEIRVSWPEFNQRTGSGIQYFAANVEENPANYPNGYKDYNVLCGLFFMPASLAQSHSVQHIKIRQAGATDYLLETTFDPFGLTVGQTKQFYPI